MQFFKKVFTAFKPSMQIDVVIEQGERGRYRWFAYRRHDLAAQGAPNGFPSYTKAMDAASAVLGNYYSINVMRTKPTK